MKRRVFLSGMIAGYSGWGWQNSSLWSPQNIKVNEGGIGEDENLGPVIDGLRILQGFTDETSAQFSIDLPRNLNVQYLAVDRSSGRRLEPMSVRTAINSKSQFRVDQVIFDNLYLNNGFYLYATDSKNEIVDVRLFKTIDTNKKSAKIALISCMYDLNENHHEMWEIIKAIDIDMYFLIGDVVYGDIGGIVHGPNFLWSRYIQTRSNLALYSQRVLTPTIAIWDDHDFGKNNADGSYEHKYKSLETFKNFYAQKAFGTNHQNGPGVSSSFSAFGQKFIFLDDRFWRNLPNRFSATGYLGDSQLDWFRDQLNHSLGQTWVIQGSQTFGSFKKESGTFELIAPQELSYLESLIRQTDKPTWFASGDVHFSEISQLDRASSLGFKSFELTSSCMHSLYLDRLPENDRRVPEAGATRENFLVIELNSETSVVKSKCYGIGNKIKFDKKLEIT